MVSASGRKGGFNEQVAERLREAADLLERQDANPFLVAAYHRVTEVVFGPGEDVASILDREGLDGLDALPRGAGQRPGPRPSARFRSLR
jgi:DNA polymerase/3'-5' exonuclease PolX